MLNYNDTTRLSRINLRVAASPFCNFNCIYCDGSKSRAPGKPGAMEDFRRKPLNEGIIKTTTLVKIIKIFRIAGFGGVTLTGGEPFLNSELDIIINEFEKMGMLRIEVTTNGMLLNTYLQKKGHMPNGLTLLKVSLDTFDPVKFRAITHRDALENVLSGIKAVKLKSPKLKIRVNKVLLRSDIKLLVNYIKFCERSNIDEITLLDLLLNNPQEKIFFQKEFISIPEVMEFLSLHIGCNFHLDKRYGYQARLFSGLRIILKDSSSALRFEQCKNCPVYCQEGLYTVRIATDGTITTCPDRTAKLPFIDGVQELKNGTLIKRVSELAELFLTQKKYVSNRNEFFRRNGIHINNIKKFEVGT